MASLCGSIVKSRRGLLAFTWSIVTLLTAIAFIIAMAFALSSRGNENEYNYNYNYGEGEEGGEDRQKEVGVAVTSRAMAFAALWTAILAGIMGVFGTVILGWQSPTGQYYSCCAGNVHRTTPLGLGSFIGALLMFANLTLVCSVLFGEFEIRDDSRGREEEGEGGEAQMANDTSAERSSLAFSIMCMFLTVIYAGFAALVFCFSNSILEENIADAREEALSPSAPEAPAGYIGGERFDVGREYGKTASASGFVAPQQSSSSLERI